MSRVNLILLIGIFQFFSVCLCISFSGQVINVPKEVQDINRRKKVEVLNGNNYQSRFDIELLPLNNDSSDFLGIKAVVNKDYKFKYRGLDCGVYELMVNSYDFVLSNDRFRIKIDEDGIIRVYEDHLNHLSYNESSEVVLRDNETLFIEFKDLKQFYESSEGSIGNMILNSPFGFIFKSKVYTILFTVTMAMMATPYIISWASPELADNFKEVQERAAERRREERRQEKLKAERAIGAVPSIRKQPAGTSGLRQRK